MTNFDCIQNINKLIDTYDGNWSVLYPHLKDRLSHYHYEELPFPGEFLFFEDDYFRFKRFMIEKNIFREPVIDIGCQLGIQSELFLTGGYVGIDRSKAMFFNSDHDKVEYIQGLFSDVDINLEGKIVISNMVLGYFHEETLLKDLEKIKKAKVLFIGSSPLVISMLKENFKNHIKLNNRSKLDDNFPKYVMYNDL